MNRIMNRVIQFSSFNLPHYTCFVSRQITFIALQTLDLAFRSYHKGQKWPHKTKSFGLSADVNQRLVYMYVLKYFI